MSELQKYDVETGSEIWPDNNGKWVDAEDAKNKIESLQARIEELEAEVELLNKREGIFRDTMGKYCGEESTVMAIAGMVWELDTLRELLGKISAEWNNIDEDIEFAIKMCDEWEARLRKTMLEKFKIFRQLLQEIEDKEE